MDEWQKRMGSARPEELVRIAEAAPEGFEEEAITAARHELVRRNLSGEVLSELKEGARERELEEGGGADKSLSAGAVIGFVILGPFLLFSFVGNFVFYAMWTRGRKRMAKEALGASVIGLMLWILLLLLLIGAASFFGW